MAPRVACIGEAMVLVSSLARLDQEPPAVEDAHLAGAEANVAVGLAAAGVAASWLGRVGADAYGVFLLERLRAAGVETGGVERDPGRPTGHYAKASALDAAGEPATTMHYRRAGSAASAMAPGFLRRPAVASRLAAASVVHASGITAALSPTSAAMMRELLARHRVSFDLNWREQMWPAGDPSAVVELAAAAEIVFTGADEALRVLGCSGPAELRRLLPAPRLLVVKDGPHRALVVERDGRVTEQPALSVEVVEPVGAGDAFAAGFLAGLVRDEPLRRCLRRGHLGAAAVLTVPGDTAPVPDLALLDASAAEWGSAHIDATGVLT